MRAPPLLPFPVRLGKGYNDLLFSCPIHVGEPHHVSLASGLK